MSIITCRHVAVEGYEINGNNTPEAEAAHRAASHVETFAGLVLRLRERNMSDDSDFYALVWDEEAQRTREIEYRTTRGWTYHNGADIDATHDVIAQAVAYETEVRFAEAQRRHAETPRKGYAARGVVKGEAVEGVIAWVGKDQPRGNWDARYGTRVDRIGIRVEGRKGLVFGNVTDEGFSFDAEPVSEADMVEWRAKCEHNARGHFSQAQALADARDPQPEPSSIVDSAEADADGWMVYAVGEAFADMEHSMGVARHVVDEGAAGYAVEGARKSGAPFIKEATVFRVLQWVARYAETSGARILHDGRGAVRVDVGDGAWMVLRPVRPVVEEPSAPVEAVSAPQAAVEAEERPEAVVVAVGAPSVPVGPREETRAATVEDVVRRLTDHGGYEWTMIYAMGWGMGPAQLGIGEAVDAAVAAGLVESTMHNGKRALRRAAGVVVPLGG